MKFLIVVNALLRRTYEIEADDQDEAIKRLWRSLPVHETELREDVMSVEEIVSHGS